MKLLILGDIFGRTGRRMIQENIVELRTRYAPDFMIANSENITGGRWPIQKHVIMLQELGFDVLTGWNHTFSNLKDAGDIFTHPESIQIRPLNYSEYPEYKIPWKGYRIVEKNWQKLLVVNIMSSVFLQDHLDNPFQNIERFLTQQKDSYDAIIVDFHRETTAELVNMAYFLDGRVSLVYGTHTHVQTNDDRIFPKGTGMITDVGMTGPLWSSVGHTFESRLPQLLTGTKLFGPKAEPVVGVGILTWIFVEIQNGRCVYIEKIRIQE
jgi:metallophosphoesterase (TIGR00282 family)